MKYIQDIKDGERKVILLRVGLDTGAGGQYAPIFDDNTFEYIPIPSNQGKRTYSDIPSRYNKEKMLLEFFPERKREQMKAQNVHEDPEFETFTYGDPAVSRRGLRKLKKGDMLVFFCGLQRGEGRKAKRAIYLMGYFNVDCAGSVASFTKEELAEKFAKNHHVENEKVFNEDSKNNKLTLVKGGEGSRLLTKARCISFRGKDCAGRPHLRISKEMQGIFSNFGGKTSLQRASVKVVKPNYVERAMNFMRKQE